MDLFSGSQFHMKTFHRVRPGDDVKIVRCNACQENIARMRSTAYAQHSVEGRLAEPQPARPSIPMTRHTISSSALLLPRTMAHAWHTTSWHAQPSASAHTVGRGANPQGTN